MSSSLPPFNPSPAFRYTTSPDPDWKFTQGLGNTALKQQWLDGEKQGWTEINPEQLQKRDLYLLLISGIVPRPIAFVSSLSATGVPNLAPFSYFSLVCHDPPLISISVNTFQNHNKDTAANIKATKEFTVQIISEPFLEAANVTAMNAPPHVSEWPSSGLTPIPSTIVRPARVKESAFSMECELYQSHDLCAPGTDRVGTVLILGLIKYIHVRNDVYIDGAVDPIKYRALSRMGSQTYGRIGEGFDIPRPAWANVSQEVEEINEQASSKI